MWQHGRNGKALLTELQAEEQSSARSGHLDLLLCRCLQSGCAGGPY